MPETRRTKRWSKALSRWAGLVLVAVCLVYLAEAVARLDLGPLIASLGWREWSSIGALALVYAASLSLLATAWAALAAPRRKLPPTTAIAIYGPGAIAKYLPGSVFQYASRHLLGRGKGLTHGTMACASVVEALLHVGIALALGASLLAGGGFWAASAFAVLGGVLALRPIRPLVTGLALQLVFFALFAAIVIALASFGASADDPGRLAGYFFIAWIAGFLVPVAPGGIGVREAVLLAFAVEVESASVVAMLALLTRLVGTAGDGLFGVAGYLAARSKMQASA